MRRGIDYYRALQNAKGATSNKEVALWKIQRELKSSFMTPINWEVVTLNGVPSELQILPSIVEYEKKIISKPGALLLRGSIVVWGQSQWLITDLDYDSQLQYQGTMLQCNVIFRWQNEKGNIVSCLGTTEDATKYSSGVVAKETMQIPQFNIKAKVPINEETLAVERDKRFLLGDYYKGGTPDAFMLTRVNKITRGYEYTGGPHDETGYIEWTLTEDQFKPSADNPELGIADYRATEGQSQEEDEEEDGGWF